MKKLLFSCVMLVLLVVSGCKPGANGELVGTGRDPFFQETPFGMLFIPLGSFHMGPSDQEITFALSAQKKVVSIQSFYMDETEITNDEYRQFTYHVRDSLALSLLGEEDPDKFIVNEGEYDQRLDWRRIPWYDETYEEVLSNLFYGENDERFYKRKQLDARKFNFEYWWIDFKTASQKAKRYSHPDIKQASASTESWKYGDGISDRSEFIKREVVNVYPDTLAWVHDFTYSWNEPMTQMYFWHPVYDHYPVVGVSWKQATAFCIWRTHLMNDFRRDRGKVIVNDFRLPTEAEWEYASRGNFDQSPYPWGGPYIRNRRGCFREF
jgi:formylglycine-generating enzyme required for sulfatase activity